MVCAICGAEGVYRSTHYSQPHRHLPVRRPRSQPPSARGRAAYDDEAPRVREISWTELLDILDENRATFVGASLDPQRHMIQHRCYDGFYEMFYCKTDDMKADESYLLRYYKGTQNGPIRGVVQNRRGYVYAIFETRKFEQTPSNRRLVIKNVEMSAEMQQAAIDCASVALAKYTIERDAAAYIKKEFDKLYTPAWHCIIGRNFGSHVTYERNNYIHFCLGQIAILLFKNGSAD